jgi:hypothetical protein
MYIEHGKGDFTVYKWDLNGGTGAKTESKRSEDCWPTDGTSWLYCLLLDLGRFFSFLILYTVSSTPWTGDQPVARCLPAHTGQHKHRINV